MTKRDLMEALNQLDDDAEIHVMCWFDDESSNEYLHDIDYDDVVSGDELQNEITIIGHL